MPGSIRSEIVEPKVTCGLVAISAALCLAATSGCSPSAPAKAPTVEYSAVHVYPHDAEAFTQGLVYVDGYLYESTGLTGRSSLRKVDLQTGRVVSQRNLEAKYFGEGLTDWQDRLVQLTWRAHMGFVYDRSTFELQETFTLPGQGWGIAHDAQSLIVSDGSATLRFLDPHSFQVQRRLVVTDGGSPIRDLNELEWVNGQIYANVWHSDRIARISPQSGVVTGWIDLSGLLPATDRPNGEAVLNGIAFDRTHNRLFVTGKLWPKLFEIRPRPQVAASPASPGASGRKNNG